MYINTNMFDSALKTDSLLKIYYVKNIYYNIKQEKIKLGKLKSLIYLSEGKFFFKIFQKRNNTLYNKVYCNKKWDT